MFLVFLHFQIEKYSFIVNSMSFKINLYICVCKITVYVRNAIRINKHIYK